MARKKVRKRNSTKRVNARNSKRVKVKSVPNPFNRLSGVQEGFKQMPVPHKVVLIALLLFIGMVIANAGDSNLGNNITGAAIDDITGNQISTNQITKVSSSIKGALSIITEGIAKPIFDLFKGARGDIVIKVLLTVVLYFVLIYIFKLKDAMEGKGKVVAALIAILGSALIPVDTFSFLKAILTGVLSFYIVIGFFLLVLWWLHNRPAETVMGHIAKALAYLIFVFFLTDSTNAGNFNLRQAIAGTALSSIGELVITFMIIYAIIMVFVEIFRIRHYFGGGSGPRDRDYGGGGSGSGGSRRRGFFGNLLDAGTHIAKEVGPEIARSEYERMSTDEGRRKTQISILYSLAKKYNKLYQKLDNPGRVRGGAQKVRGRDIEKAKKALINKFRAEARKKCPDLDEKEINKAVDIVTG